MDTGLVFQQMLILVIIMAIGFFVRRIKLIDTRANTYLTKLLLKVTLPATMLTATANSTLEVPFGHVFILSAAIIFSFVIMGILSFLAPLVMRTKRDETGAYAALGLFANVNFMGIPLTYALFGPNGMFYAVLYNIVFNLLVFSLGMKLIGGKKAKISVKFFLSPVMISSVIAVIMFLLGIRLPYVLDSGARLLGGITSPLAMLLLGSILGGMQFREMFRGWRVYGISFVRLVIAPIAVYFLLSPLPISRLFLAVAVVMAASPMAVSLATFSIHYSAHEELVGKGIFLSTLFSVLTMPLVLSFLL